MMEMKPQLAPAPSLNPEPSADRKEAIAAVRNAVAAIQKYQQSDRQRMRFEPNGFEDPKRDEVYQIVEDELLPLFLGAPGEQCDACGGSGRKR